MRRVFFGAIMIFAAASFGIFGGSMHVRAADFAEINASKENGGVQGIIFAGICSSVPSENGAPTGCPCRDSGNCTLDDALQVLVNVSTFILGISGTAVLFVFVYGGFKWLYSRGKEKWITEGKEAMTAGAIGLVIIFGAYVAINFIVAGLIAPAGTAPQATPLEETVDDALEQGGADGATPIFTTE